MPLPKLQYKPRMDYQNQTSQTIKCLTLDRKREKQTKLHNATLIIPQMSVSM